MIEISVVIPAYNEERRLGASLGAVASYLERRGSDYEILVVDDGSTDSTSKVVSSFEERGVRLLRLPRNRGKGAAVRLGVLATSGARILLSDADLSTPIDQLERLEPRLEEAPLVFGSRASSETRIGRHQPFYRELMGKAFNRMIRGSLIHDLKDTQCGFKLLDGEVGRELFGEMLVDGFAFDVELAWLARRHGHRVVEVGVVWNHDDESKVRLARDALGMALDVWLIPIRHRRRRRASSRRSEGLP